MVLRRLLAVSLVLFLVAADSPEPAPAREPKSPAAVKAIGKSKIALTRAEEEFRRAKGVALKQLIAELKPAQDQATKAGALDEAVAIKTAIQKAQAELESLDPTKA